MSSPEKPEDILPRSLEVVSATTKPDGTGSFTFRLLGEGEKDMVFETNGIPVVTLEMLKQTMGTIEELAAGLKAGDSLTVDTSVKTPSKWFPNKQEKPVATPSSFWLSALLSLDDSEDAIFNMEEMYRNKWSKRYPLWRAKLIWYFQVFRVVTLSWKWVVGALLVGAWNIIKIKLG